MNNETRTRHAEERKAQRAISDVSLELALSLGTPLKKSRGATEYRFGRKECRQAEAALRAALRELQRAGDTAVLEEDGQIVTVYHLTKKHLRR